MSDDLSIRITIEHGHTTCTAHLPEDENSIDEVLETLGFLLVGIGFHPNRLDRLTHWGLNNG